MRTAGGGARRAHELDVGREVEGEGWGGGSARSAEQQPALLIAQHAVTTLKVSDNRAALNARRRNFAV